LNNGTYVNLGLYELETREFGTNNELLAALKNRDDHYITREKNGPAIEIGTNDGSMEFKVRSSFRLRTDVGGRIVKLAKSSRPLSKPELPVRSYFA
jgi:hypothetical protein